jgi:F0F1-type ATP synthase assembly protein I
VRDDEQGLASGLVGSSFQIGGAIVLAITTAAILAQTPADATAAESVHAFTAGVYVSVASACLLLAIAVAGWRAERCRAAEERDATTDATDADAIDAKPLDLAA